ncbi:cysteine synthase A [Candidatus Woesearchaeota archaeon CG10_big_fil_rev_8_21_14_0_10_32_24]|nr:MAG: cysteine synthase A [Candidatus Woesearchaeota archaeon CG10_big_fil_rev_8_21_14_0_10_32_24]
MINVGNTPLIEVDGIYAKLECVNPTGSIKDRMVQYVLDKSEKQGILTHGMTIIEATSGNTGIALSYFGREKGYPVTIIMPSDMSEERKEMITSLGAELILVSPGNFRKAGKLRDKMASQDPKYFNTRQFSNPLNVQCHYETTGQEIIKQMNGKSIDAFVAGVGTGGSLIEIAKALKEVNPNLIIVAVEPYESSVMSGGKSGSHTIQGIGDGFIPQIVGDGNGGLHELIDDIIRVKSDFAKEATKYLSHRKGFCVGVSSGANYLASRKLHHDVGNIVTIFPDGFGKYKSFGLTHCERGRCPYEKDRKDVLVQLNIST